MDSRIVGVKGRNIIDDRKCMITCNDILIIFGNDLEIKRTFQYQNNATRTLDVTNFGKSNFCKFWVYLH